MTFSHDGLRDSLTHVAAPPYFYESVRREISLSHRSGSQLTAITFHLVSAHAIHDYPLIAFAEIATRAFRFEDHIGRLGENTFIVLITGDVDVAEQITDRVIAQWALQGVPGISLHYSWSLHVKGEDCLEFLNRLDSQPLTSKEF